MSWVSCGLSTTQGPAIRNSGRSGPISAPGELHALAAAAAGSCGRAACSRAARTKLVNSGWPSRGFEVNSGWNCTPMNQGCAGSSTISTRPSSENAEIAKPGLLHALEVVVVELVAVAVALVDHVAAVDLAGQRAGQDPRFLRAEAHRAAELGAVVALQRLAACGRATR